MAMEKTAVTCVSWVPRGKSAPRQDDLGDDEELQDAEPAAPSSSAAGQRAAELADEYKGMEAFDLEHYDDDSDDGMQFFSILKADEMLNRTKDPYLTGDADSRSDSDGNVEIRPQDHVFVAASAEEDVCNLELYVFDEDDADMYVHHDAMVSAYPLCIEWISSVSTGREGSFAAIGLMDHTIQLWDLDAMGAMEPCMMLSEGKKASSKKAGKTKRKQKAATAHDAPVLAIHGSSFNRNVLASASADESVKVWDVSENSCVHKYTHHTDKVQVARWHWTEQGVLLTAAFDRKLALLDVRQPGQIAMVDLPAEAESAIWSRHQPFQCIASADNGDLACYDVRKVASKAPVAEQVLWTLSAHDVACTSVVDTPTPNLLVTCGLEGEAKVWDASSGSTPKLVFAKQMQAGPLFASQSNPEAPALVVFGGKCPVMWDLTSDSVIASAFNLGQ